MPAEDHLRLDVEARRADPEQRMHAEALAAGAEVVDGSDGVRAEQDTPIGPPERHFLPATARAYRQELERPEPLPGDDMMRNAEAVRERGAIAIVTVQQLDDCGRCSCASERLVVEGIDQPPLPAGQERVAAALHELVGDPTEAAVELVYDVHFATHAS